MTLDEIATSADIGRINPDQAPLEYTIVCPAISFSGKQVSRPTMTIEQCKLRLANRDRICIKCKVVKAVLPNLPKLEGKKYQRYSWCECGYKFEPHDGATKCPICTLNEEIPRTANLAIRKSLEVLRRQILYRRKITKKKG